MTGHAVDLTDSKAPREAGLVQTSPYADVELPGHFARPLIQPPSGDEEEGEDYEPDQDPSAEEGAAVGDDATPTSIAFDPYLRPSLQAPRPFTRFVQSIVDELGRYERTQGLRKVARLPLRREAFIASIEALVCNLIVAHQVSAGLSVWLSQKGPVRRYGDGDPHYGNGPRGESLRDAIRLMETFGFMQQGLVGCRTQDGHSFPTRFGIGDAFKERMAKSDLPHAPLFDLSTIRSIATVHPRKLVILKSAKKEAIDYRDDTKRVREVQATVVRINQHLAETPLALVSTLHGGPPLLNKEGRAVVNPSRRTLHRTFNEGSWTAGGRLFGGFWQTMRREDRARCLRLGNRFSRRASEGFCFEEVANVDYGQLYLRLAYLHLGLMPPDGDLYAIPGYEECREGLKVLTSAMLFRTGVERLRGWPRKALGQFPKGTALWDVKDAIAAKHWPLRGLFEADGIGHRFAFIESQMLNAVLRRLRAEDIPALPLFDAVLVARSRAQEAKVAMVDAAPPYAPNGGIEIKIS